MFLRSTIPENFIFLTGCLESSKYTIFYKIQHFKNGFRFKILTYRFDRSKKLTEHLSASLPDKITKKLLGLYATNYIIMLQSLDSFQVPVKDQYKNFLHIPGKPKMGGICRKPKSPLKFDTVHIFVENFI